MDLTPIPARPQRSARRRPGFGLGIRFEVMERDPAVERVSELSRTLVSVLASLFGTAVALSLAGWANSVQGWILLGLAGLAGLSPLAWYRHRARRVGRLAVWELDPRSARLVTAAAGEANTLRLLADRAPDGPVASHLHHLARTAQDYVVALHQAALNARAAGRDQGDPELDATMARIVGQLADLTAAAGRLREAQRRHLQASPLEQLTEATDQLTAALEHPPLDR